MQRINYEGHEIYSASMQIAESKKWTVEVNIVTSQGDKDIEQPFISAITFEDKEDADNYSVNFGKQIIDGKFPNLSLAKPS